MAIVRGTKAVGASGALSGISNIVAESLSELSDGLSSLDNKGQKKMASTIAQQTALNFDNSADTSLQATPMGSLMNNSIRTR